MRWGNRSSAGVPRRNARARRDGLRRSGGQRARRATRRAAKTAGVRRARCDLGSIWGAPALAGAGQPRRDVHAGPAPRDDIALRARNCSSASSAVVRDTPSHAASERVDGRRWSASTSPSTMHGGCRDRSVPAMCRRRVREQRQARVLAHPYPLPSPSDAPSRFGKAIATGGRAKLSEEIESAPRSPSPGARIREMHSVRVVQRSRRAGLAGSRTTASKSMTPSNEPPVRIQRFTAWRFASFSGVNTPGRCWSRTA